MFIFENCLYFKIWIFFHISIFFFNLKIVHILIFCSNLKIIQTLFFVQIFLKKEKQWNSWAVAQLDTPRAGYASPDARAANGRCILQFIMSRYWKFLMGRISLAH
jgi:hypothetical protein